MRPDGFGDLPKRFRAYVEELEGQVSALRKARPTTARTSVEIVDYLAQPEDKTYLPDGTRIRFRLGEAEWEVGQARPTRTGGTSALELALNQSSVGSSLAVFPEASNLIVVVPRRYS
jgi:hypothetical protein